HLTDLSSSVLLVGILLGLAGMELSAVHAGEVENPQKDYPRAMLIAVMIIIVLSLLGSLAISVVVPVKKLSLIAGVMEAFAVFFQAYHLEWMTPILAALIVIGALSMISTWIVGPSKGLMVTAHQGDLPPICQKVNAEKMPVNLLYFQAILVTILSCVFLFMPSVSSSYWILTALTTQLYLFMYLLMFISAIVLRYKRAQVVRAYRIPGGKNAGMWLVSGLGIVGCVFSILIGFIPPKQLSTGSLIFYELFLGGGMFVMCVVPWIVELFKTKKWVAFDDEQRKS
ncbi:MAG: amino acid permease, partial [Verrucomicrobia bacterium]|nr:amino acid permease [Verrucomicrobiota bacterium]